MKNLNKTLLMLATFGSLLQACKKGNSPNGGGGGSTNDTTSTTIIAPTEPAIANTQGFFLNNWQAKTWVAPPTKPAAKPAANVARLLSLVPKFPSFPRSEVALRNALVLEASLPA